ncbi:SusC/RagA family TonB-linked outer membrane protein [Pontibacter sp. SGAir0037]|uniref:SusC/RagA family TonB-linked outer membrane protein n=1 Tax=Pontibacter sp. SGAir0037 TaxID=2571030 RepID=UPI00143DB93A|nr:SusC/RagA family TonB-linked outer membrane protein [Pontibacter sp. SGAir0037]
MSIQLRTTNRKVLLVVATLHLGAFSFPGMAQHQDPFISMRSTDNAAATQKRMLKDVLYEIEERYGVSIIYEGSLLDKFSVVNKPHEHSKIGGKVEDVLKELLQPFNISYKKGDNNIYIIQPLQSEAPAAPDQKVSPSRSHTEKAPKAAVITLRGRVVDEKGEGMPGVTVVLKGTATGVSTDYNGNFTMEVPDQAGILVFSFLGYKIQEVAVGSQTTFNISLEPDSKSLEEVVVVGYGTMAKSDLTGSVASLKGTDLNRTPTSSVDQLLQGKIPGVQVIAPSGEPGAGATIRIRGVSSVRGSNSPLVVVDGFPWGDAGNLKQINPEDIESIEVLKDASAAAIYGSRGANGVILVTTKKGKEGKSRINLSTLTTVSTLANKLDVWSDPVDLAIIDNEARMNAGLQPLFEGADYLGTYYPSIAELRGEDPERPRWPHRVYWPDLVYRNPITHTYTLTATGGNDRTKYSLSGNYYNEQGLAIRNDYKRYNGRVNLEQKLLNNLTAGVNLIMTHTQRNGGGLSAGRSPIFPVYNEDGSYFRIGSLDYNHPLARAYEVLNTNKAIDVLGSLSLNWEINSWLSFRTQVSNKYGSSINDWYEPREATYTGYQFQGFGAIDNWSGNELLNENYFTIQKSFNEVHNLNLVAGYTTQLSTSRGSRLEGRDFVNDVLRNENINTAQEQVATNWLSRSLLNSYIGRATYSLLDRYLFTFTARADGSSKFGPNNKWAFFPSAAIAWKIQEESFMQALPAVSEAKIRLSYGLTGNQGISPYQTLDRLGSGRYFTDGGFQIGFGPGIFDWDGYNKIWSGLPNPSLKWETTSQFNAGIDLGLLNNRFTLTADYYYKHTTDLLRQSYITPSSGYDRIWVNDGIIDNYGLELGLNTQILTGELQWNLGGNITLNRNKVVNIGGGNLFEPNGSTIEMFRSFVGVYMNGQPINAFYGYKTDGIIQTLEEGLEAGLTGSMAYPGEIKYVDLDRNGVIDDKDRTIIGNPNPDFLYSINTNLSYKRFDLSAQLYGVHGNDVFEFNKFSAPSRQLQRWTPDNPSVEYPSVNSARGYYASDFFITDGSFLRVQNIALGYNLKPGLIKGVESMRVYLSGNNLYTFTRFNPGYDPEVSENGQQWGSYPRPRALSLGLNIGF